MYINLTLTEEEIAKGIETTVVVRQKDWDFAVLQANENELQTIKTQEDESTRGNI